MLLAQGSQRPLPSKDEAAQLAREELNKPQYADGGPSLWDYVKMWIQDVVRSGETAAAGISPWLLVAVLGCVIALGVGVALASRQWSLAAKSRQALAMTHFAELTARELAAKGAAAESEGDHNNAVLWYFRACVAALREQHVTELTHVLTSAELLSVLHTVAPATGQIMARAADVFDEVVYGQRDAEPSSVALLAQTFDQVAARTAAAAAGPITGAAPDGWRVPTR